MRNIDACLYVRPSDRTTLERLVVDGKTAQKIVARARIVLLSGRGFGTNSIFSEARVSKPTVWRWQKAYMDGGVERLLKDRGKGARAGKKPISAEVRLAIVKRTAQEKPKHATHWSALDVKTGEVIGECLPRHRAKEFIRFLKKINRAVAKHLDVHAICDNYKTHKTKEVQAWLAKHPRFKLHFTPTSSSWINLVERLFAEITRQQIRRGVFKSVAELEAAIETWLTERNAKPKPFKWTAKANIILEKNARARRALEEDLAAGTK